MNECYEAINESAQFIQHYLDKILRTNTQKHVNLSCQMILLNVYMLTGLSLTTSYYVVNINRFRPRVTRLATHVWFEQSHVNITWEPVHLGLENQTVEIQLARFSMKNNGHVFFHSMFTLVTEQMNTGEATFVVPKGKGQG